jgi:hypothetical protein
MLHCFALVLSDLASNFPYLFKAIFHTLLLHVAYTLGIFAALTSQPGSMDSLSATTITS